MTNHLPRRLPTALVLLALAAGSARAQEAEPDEPTARALVARGEVLAARGRFHEAIAAATSALLLAPAGPAREAITLTRFAVEVAAVASHVAGKDSGLRGPGRAAAPGAAAARPGPGAAPARAPPSHGERERPVTGPCRTTCRPSRVGPGAPCNVPALVL